MIKILETKRLFLRELNVDDCENIYKLNLNINVIKYTGDSAFKSIDEAKEFLGNYNDYEYNGYGRWAVVNKKTNEFIGWCGLKYNELANETDIGFRFFEKDWNNGFATESAKACIDYGFKNFKLKRIIGRAMKDNIGSVNVLIKIGMVYIQKINFEGKEGVLYAIDEESN
ncbi:Protein N-acetyltransferase, RimJ/RimL family [Lutibacter oricola]|uniref:Protein N-acetyltransferase, RimJ/RimL family n=1 Tax=Lutibacter oricola TaxID=762486 RepID=A0A1H3ETY1_9FLAO|nr:GNAT family N-acetyltransferase [Lutibacter oricola]SDX81389.1 Protein N-acetyltransferase, RimJ/RimL family [Lutibacter oricola]